MKLLCEVAGTALRKYEAQKRIHLRQHISSQRGKSLKTIDKWGREQSPTKSDALWMIINFDESYSVEIVRELGRRARFKTLLILIFNALLRGVSTERPPYERPDNNGGRHRPSLPSSVVGLAAE